MASKRLTLQQIQLRAWLASALCAVVVCFAVVYGMSYAQHKTRMASAVNSFSEKSEQAFRRIEAELAVNNSAAVPALADIFEKELEFDRIQLIRHLPDSCTNPLNCLFQESGKAVRAKAIQTKYGSHVLTAEKSLPSLWADFNIDGLWWTIIAISALAFAGALIHRFVTRRYITRPISQLIEHTHQCKETPEYYPAEIKQLAEDLNTSIEARDRVIYGQIASGVIHDLRTQIHSLLSATSLVSEVAESSDKRPKRLELLYQAGARNLPRMLKIIEATLDGSREIKVTPTDTDLKNTLKESLADCAELAKCRNIQIEAEYSDVPELRHDRVQLERVFSNLIKNAIEAFDNDDGSLNRRYAVQVSARCTDTQVEINVEDSGPGLSIPSRELFRLSKTTKPNGSGLGLLIARRIVEAHGGKIRAQTSSRLRGARFTVHLPLQQAGGAA